MTQQDTYGQKMAAWERHQDLRQWEMRLKIALMTLDMDLIRDLVQEGLDNDYPLDSYKDNELFRHFLKELI